MYVLCECVCLQIWQDDLIHQGLPLPTLGGNKNNLAKRAVHFHMHSRTHPRLRLRGQAIGLEQPNHVTLHTRKHIKPHTPIYLNLATCLCIGTNAVKPPLGCGMNSKAICLVSTHPLSLSRPFSLFLSACLFSFSFKHVQFVLPLVIFFFFPYHRHTQLLHAHQPPVPPFFHPLQARTHHRGVC